MNLDLAQMYGTPGADAAAAEEQEKTAQAELFAKLAADEGIDLNQLSDDQVQELWDMTFSKEAQEEGKPCPDCGKEKCTCPKAESKEAAAYAEYLEQQEGQDKVAEADHLGRVMAHAYVQELGEIGEAMDKEAAPSAVELGMRARDLGSRGLKALKGAGRGISRAARASEFRSGRRIMKDTAPGSSSALKSRVFKRSVKNAPKGAREEYAKQTLENLSAAGKKRMLRGGAKTTALYGTGAAAAGGGAYAMNKKSSALDELALQLAFEKGAEAGFEPQELEERLLAIETLGGLEPSEKVAASADFEDAVDTRALEYLDVAGYPVEWE